MAKTSKKPRAKPKSNPGGVRLFEFEVALIQGPITPKFARQNRKVIRTIQIRGDQTLEELHLAIFKSFDRYDAHMYEFQVGGKRAMDPHARRYVLPVAMDDDYSDSKPAGSVVETTIESLGLKKNDVFGYWFDFGDDWWHQINVEAIDNKVPNGTFPKVTKKVGKSPPQYPDEDE